MSELKNEDTTEEEHQIDPLSEPSEFTDEFFNLESTSSLRTSINKCQLDLIFRYYNMEYVASLADDCFVLNNPIKFYFGGHITKQRAAQYEKDVVFVSEYDNTVNKMRTKLEKHLNLRRALFNQIRQIYPDFCFDMEKKIDEKDFKFYKENRKNLHQLISKNPRYNINVSSEEILNQLRDDLSKLIDSKAFLKACIAENEFVLSELDIFFDLLSKIPPEERNNFSEFVILLSANSSYTLPELVEKLRSDVSANLTRDLEVQEMQNKLSNSKQIKLTINSNNKKSDGR